MSPASQEYAWCWTKTASVRRQLQHSLREVVGQLLSKCQVTIFTSWDYLVPLLSDFVLVFFICLVWGAHPGSTRGLLLILNSRITSGRLRQPNGMLGIEPGWLCAKQIPILLFYHSSPFILSFFRHHLILFSPLEHILNEARNLLYLFIIREREEWRKGGMMKGCVDVWIG